MQSLNSCYYCIEWEENKNVKKARIIRAISSIFKILTVIFAIIAVFSIMDIGILVGFCVGATAAFAFQIVLDYIAGAMLFSYVYVLSDGELELKKEYKNGKTEIVIKSECSFIELNDVIENDDCQAEKLFSQTAVEIQPNYCKIESEKRDFVIAVDDYMLAVLRRICK